MFVAKSFLYVRSVRISFEENRLLDEMLSEPLQRVFCSIVAAAWSACVHTLKTPAWKGKLVTYSESKDSMIAFFKNGPNLVFNQSLRFTVVLVPAMLACRVGVA